MTRNRFQVIKRRPKEERTADGVTFDSVGEMRRWQELKDLQQRGLIRALTRQVPFILMAGDVVILTPTGKPARYKPDFMYEEIENTAHGTSEWTVVYEEYKGIDDPTSQLRRSVFEAKYCQAHENRQDRKVRLSGPAANPKRKKKVSS